MLTCNPDVGRDSARHAARKNRRDVMEACHCGHAVEEHGGDPAHPGSTACTVDGCDCIAYERCEDEED